MYDSDSYTWKNIFISSITIYFFIGILVNPQMVNITSRPFVPQFYRITHTCDIKDKRIN